MTMPQSYNGKHTLFLILLSLSRDRRIIEKETWEIHATPLKLGRNR